MLLQSRWLRACRARSARRADPTQGGFMAKRWISVLLAAVTFGALACAPSTPPAAPTAAAPTTAAKPAEVKPGGSPEAKPAPTPQAQPASSPSLAAQAKPGQRATVRVAGAGGSTYRALFVGQEKGFFEEQGIDLDIQIIRATSGMVPLLATGRLDAGQGGNYPGFFNAALSGTGVKVVSDVTVFRPPGPGIKNSLWLIVRKDLTDQVKSVADLKGRKVAITAAGSAAEELLEETLKYHRMTLSDVEEVTVAFPDQLAALSNKAVDAAIGLEPLVSQADEQNIAAPLFEVATALQNYTVQWLFYGGDFIKNQPDVGKRFLVAYTKALRYMEDAWRKGVNRSDVVQMFIKNTPVKDARLYDRMGVSYSETNGRVNVRALETDEDFFFRQGLLKQKVELSSLVDTSFGEYAVQVLGRYPD